MGLVQAFGYPDWTAVGLSLAGDFSLVIVGLLTIYSGIKKLRI